MEDSEEDKEYDVEKIIEERLDRDGALWLLVKWKGYELFRIIAADMKSQIGFLKKITDSWTYLPPTNQMILRTLTIQILWNLREKYKK